MKASFVGSFIGFYILLSSYCYAQTVLPEVSVRDSAAHSRAQLTSTAPVFELGNKEFHDLGIKDVAEALRLANGITVKDYGGLGGMKTVSVRNLGAEHTGVLYDGVPVSNCQAGQIDIARFSTENLSSIRMGIGAPTEMLMPASMEPYSGTLVMNTNKKDSWAKVSYGSWNTLSTSANMNYKGVNSFLAYNHTDGGYPFILTNGQEKTKEHRNNSRVDAINGEINYGWSSSNQTIDIKTYYYYSDRQLPGGIIYYNNEAHERLWDENTFTQMRYKLNLSSQWDFLAIAKYNHSWNKYFDGNQIDDGGVTMHTYKYRQNETFASVGMTYRVEKTNDKLQFSAVVDELWNTLCTNIPEFTNKYRTTTYATLRARYHNSWITANASALYTYLNEKNNTKKLTPSASLSIKPFVSKDLYIRTSWRKAFRLPTFNDMYYYRLGNHNLKPERTNEWNIGLTYSHEIQGGDFSITADAYYNKVRDLIVAIPTTFAWKMYNYGKAYISGINMAIDYSVKDFTLNIGYNLNDAITGKRKYSERKQVPYTARHSGNVSAVWKNPIANIGYSMQWMGRRYSSIIHERRYRLNKFDDHNFNISHIFEIGKNSLDISLACKNILDRQYEIIQFYPMPGRQFIINAKYNLK